MRYILKRIFSMFVVIFIVSIIIFTITRVLPKDPAAYMLGGPRATKESIENLRKELKLDLPIYIQYIEYMKGILLEGNFGKSLIEMRDISDIVKEKFPLTLELVIGAMSLAIVLGIPLGVVSAIHKNKGIDQFCRIFSVSGVSVPEFWIGIMLQLLLGYVLSLVPLTGRISGLPPQHITGLYLLDSLITLNFSAFLDSLHHIILPIIILSFSPLANITRMLRANMLDELNKDYVVVAKCSGIPEKVIIWKYVFKNAFCSTLTTIGTSTGLMIGGTFVVEQIFALPGLSRFGTSAFLYNDFNGVCGVVLIFSFFFVLINFVVDLFYGYLDPRIRLKEVGE